MCVCVFLSLSPLPMYVSSSSFFEKNRIKCFKCYGCCRCFVCSSSSSRSLGLFDMRAKHGKMFFFFFYGFSVLQLETPSFRNSQNSMSGLRERARAQKRSLARKNLIHRYHPHPAAVAAATSKCFTILLLLMMCLQVVLLSLSLSFGEYVYVSLSRPFPVYRHYFRFFANFFWWKRKSMSLCTSHISTFR